MSVLQKMQEETAQLHRRFLEGQETASRTIQTLLEQQHRILNNGAALTTPQSSSAANVTIERWAIMAFVLRQFATRRAIGRKA